MTPYKSPTGKVIESEENVKDRGVISEKLDYEDHIEKVILASEVMRNHFCFHKTTRDLS